MMNTFGRIERLERIIKESTGKFVFVHVTFTNGGSRRMKAADLIPMLLEPDVDSIISIEGTGGGASGLLIELERGLIQE